MSARPPEPAPQEPDASWEHYSVYKGVKDALYSLPTSFRSPLNISGVLATDLFAFNSSLGATIEDQVVETLNSLRGVWDPEKRYVLYSFERRPQTFPDVVLRTKSPGVQPRIILGIELKGWYVLAKEREPSFRYKVTRTVCAPADLLVVVPWVLSEVISGSPEVLEPYVVPARFAAEYRNWWWQYARDTRGDRGIQLSKVAAPYPVKTDEISDRPASDSGGNFGRFARTGLMDEYVKTLFGERLSGIPLGAWQSFFALFKEDADLAQVEQRIRRISAEAVSGSVDPGIVNDICSVLGELVERLRRD